MKRLLLLTISVYIILILAGCPTPGGGGGPTEKWTLSGNVTITEDDGVASDVKLACFFINSGGVIPDDLGAQVSNLINLEQVIGAPIAFTLNIDASGIVVTETDGITLFVWEDTDGDNQYDDVEDGDILEADIGCSVFGAVACFIYYDTNPLEGWYLLDTGFNLVSIDNATLTGADIETFSGL